MFGTLVHKFQAIGSPLGSPVVSPISSPKGTRKGYGAAAKHLAHRRAAMKQEFREVQSDPEDTIGSCSENKKCKIKRKLDKRKHANKPTIEMISAPCPLLNSLSKSMGRLDGLKQVDYNIRLLIILNDFANLSLSKYHRDESVYGANSVELNLAILIL